jgi:hypothetical protein
MGSACWIAPPLSSSDWVAARMPERPVSSCRRVSDPVVKWPGISFSEIDRPKSGTFELTGFMQAPRRNHAATLLEDGTVLVAGGYNGNDLNAPELYQPKTGAFKPTGAMSTARRCRRVHALALCMESFSSCSRGQSCTAWRCRSNANSNSAPELTRIPFRWATSHWPIKVIHSIGARTSAFKSSRRPLGRGKAMAHRGV